MLPFLSHFWEKIYDNRKFCIYQYPIQNLLRKGYTYFFFNSTFEWNENYFAQIHQCKYTILSYNQWTWICFIQVGHSTHSHSLHLYVIKIFYIFHKSNCFFIKAFFRLGINLCKSGVRSLFCFLAMRLFM